MSAPKPAGYQGQAICLVAASAFALLFIGVAMQVGVWELRGAYMAARLRPTTLAGFFLDTFGHRPDGYLIAAVFWLWWPMPAVLVWCAQCHRDPQAFATAFLFGFVCCWVGAATVLTFLVA